MHTELNWQGEMAFDIELDSHHFTIDADEKVGGTDKGPRPKGLLLSGLAGCTAMDVVSLLKKMRIPLENMKIKVDASLTDEHPKVFSEIVLIYEFYGKNLSVDKIHKAVNLSRDKYCGVSAMLKKVADISYEIKIIET